MNSLFVAVVLLALAGSLQGCQRDSKKSLSQKGEVDCNNIFQGASASRSTGSNNTECQRSVPSNAPEQNPLDTRRTVIAAQPVPSAAGDSAVDRYVYCQFHKEDVISLAKELDRANAEVVTAATRSSPGSQELIDAERTHQDVIDRLDKLLPATLRKGMPLVPDALNAFSTCDKERLK